MGRGRKISKLEIGHYGSRLLGLLGRYPKFCQLKTMMIKEIFVWILMLESILMLKFRNIKGLLIKMVIETVILILETKIKLI